MGPAQAAKAEAQGLPLLIPYPDDFPVFIDPSHQTLLTFVKNVVIHQ